MMDASELLRIARAPGLDTPVLQVSAVVTMMRLCLTAMATRRR